ncbi:protein Abitram-like [Ornithodoros turicata]|uniref:protein Abitram-like n=1 Tax=Ornithodoros turicata TaxID=34597 RepID=UPI003139D2A0
MEVSGDEGEKAPESLYLRLSNSLRDTLPSVTERYYKPRFKYDANGNAGEDQCILFHSNRIALVTLAPSHPILSQKKEVTKVDFQVNTKLNRLSNYVYGKHKKGAQRLQRTSALCIISCSDGSQYTIVSVVPGKLIEVNERLTECPELVVKKPWSSGYIAIVLPPMNMDVYLLETLTSPQDYIKVRSGTIPEGYLTTEAVPEAQSVFSQAVDIDDA